MRILICGAGGYLGWPTAMMFAAAGHQVAALDSNFKVRAMRELEITTLNPVATLRERIHAWNTRTSHPGIRAEFIDLMEYGELAALIESFAPEAVIHYAEQPSAPFSMASVHHAGQTQMNNVIGTLNLIWALHEKAPAAHLVKLGTMGEYGTPNIPIREGWLDVEVDGKKDRVMYPKRPGSWYHASKVHDSVNLEMAARIWDMAVTDLNQGVVYGFRTPEMALAPGLEGPIYYDDIFGTAINRFLAQLVAEIPLTVYGGGKQKRGFLNITDTLQCVRLAVENPAGPGEFRVFNQFTEVFSIVQLAKKVINAGKGLGMIGRFDNLENPRVEAEDHPYDPENSGLAALGMKAQKLNAEILKGMIAYTKAQRGRIDEKLIDPTVSWRRGLDVKFT